LCDRALRAIENQNGELQLISGKVLKLKARSLWLSANLSNSKLSNSIIQSTSLLTDEQVREIKVLLQERKLSIKEIAELYDVSKWTVRDFKRGNSWRDVF
jgi:DNA-binding transcriptional regulator YiaG